MDIPGGSDSKALSTMKDTWIPSQGQEDLLEKEMTTHSSTLAQKIAWTEEPAPGSSVHGGGKESDTTERLHFH